MKKKFPGQVNIIHWIVELHYKMHLNINSVNLNDHNLTIPLLQDVFDLLIKLEPIKQLEHLILKIKRVFQLVSKVIIFFKHDKQDQDQAHSKFVYHI